MDKKTLKLATREFSEWLEGRPKIIQDMAAKLKPWCIYRVKPTGQHCYIYSYSENGTVTVCVNGHDAEALDALYSSAHQIVFGINPDDLDECKPKGDL